MRSLTSTRDLPPDWIQDLYREASVISGSAQKKDRLSDKLVATLFYENSTRTKSSFEIAATRAGCQLLNLDVSRSSVSKGESLADTAHTLVDLGVELVIMRHPHSGSAAELTNILAEHRVCVVNAGDGSNEHPTQALLDVYSIQSTCRELRGKKVLIVGDCLHSRVAKSNIYLLQKFEAQIMLCGPPSLLPPYFASLGVSVCYDLGEALLDTDFLMVLRLQKERQDEYLIPSLHEYHRYYGITRQKLENKLDLRQLKILHPGPANRGVEIDSDLLDDPRLSLVHDQVKNGLLIRQALLEKLLTA